MSSQYENNKKLLAAIGTPIDDDGAYYVSEEVESALQEIGAFMVAEDLWDRTGTVLHPHTSGDSVRADGGLTIGIGAAGVDYTFNIDGETNDFLATWKEDEDYLLINDDLFMYSGKAIYFRSNQAWIYSGGAGILSLVGSTSIDMSSNDFAFGKNTNADITFTFRGDTNDGELKWMEDEDYFQFSDDIFMPADERIYFNSINCYLYDNGGILTMANNGGNTVISAGGTVTLSPAQYVYIGGGGNVDYGLYFNGASNDGILKWMEDEDYFKFENNVNIDTLTASSGVYTDANKTLTSTPPTSGILGYWDRTGTTISTATAGDDVELGGNLTLALGATGKLTLNALAHTDTDGVLDINLETATANVVGMHLTTQLTGDVADVSSMQTNVLGLATGGHLGNTTYGWRAQIFGNTNDTAHTYIAVNARGQKDGGTSTLVAFNAGANFDYLLRSSSGDIQFDDYSATIKAVTASSGAGNDVTIQAGDGITAGDGGTIYLNSGSEAGGSDDGSVLISGSLGINLLAGTTPNKELDLKGSFNFIPVANAVNSMAYTLSGTAGNVDDGVHRYKVSYYNDIGETALSGTYLVVTVVDQSTSGQVLLTSIPVSPDSSVIGRKIYRSKVGLSTSAYYLVDTIADNTTTIYTDNAADASLTTTDSRNRDNYTSGQIFKSNSNYGFIGYNNMGLGYHSLGNAANPTGYFNFALGAFALEDLTSGKLNTAIGTYALKELTTASNNTGIGAQAIYRNISGYDNTAIGAATLYSVSSGRQNVAIGSAALYRFTSSYALGIGFHAGYNATSGTGFMAMGRETMYSATTPTGMTAIGYRSGYYPNAVLANACTTSTYCTFLGHQTGLGSVTQRSKSIAIGYNAVVDADNTCVIGGQGADAVSVILGDGGVANFTRIELDGTVVFNGDATVWKDINMGSAQLARPSSSQPDLVNFVDEAGADTGIQTYGFAVGEKVHGSFELQHDYKEGSDFTFHVHWQGITAPTGTDNVQWRLTYTFGIDDATLDAVTIIDSADTPFDTQYEFVRSDIVVISGTNRKIGDQMLFTLERVAATGDAYAGDASIATAGIHYEVDTVGSRQIIAK